VSFNYKDLVSSVLPAARAPGDGAAVRPEPWLACEEGTQPADPECEDGTDPGGGCGINTFPPTQGECPPVPGCGINTWGTANCPIEPAGCGPNTWGSVTCEPCKLAPGDECPEGGEDSLHEGAPPPRGAADLALLEEQLRQALAQGL
jgi:hypothetical protein